MGHLASFKKIVIWQILLLAALQAVCALALGYRAAARGFVLGSLFSLANFLLMLRQAPRLLGKERKAATISSALNLVLRLAVLAIPLYLALKRPELSLIWTICGILSLQIAILLHGTVTESLRLLGIPVDERR